MWWFKKYPEILKKESNELSSNGNYDEKFQVRDNLLISTGEILIRLKSTKRYPILIVYHPGTPFVLPTVFMLKESLTETESNEIAALDYSQLSDYLKDKVEFLYLRHQGSDGRICLLEQDNIEISGIEFFSANQIIDRVRKWLAGINTGNFPKDSPEIELYNHFKNKNHDTKILYPEIFLDNKYVSGLFYLSLMSHVSKEMYGYNRSIFLGCLMEGQNAAGIFLPIEEYKYQNLRYIPGLENYTELTTNETLLSENISKGEIIKGYWWNIPNEPNNFQNIDEFIAMIGGNNYELGMNRIHNTMQNEFKSLNDSIYLGIRYDNRRQELEWQFFKLIKKSIEYITILGDLSVSHIRDLMNNYEIEAIYSESFLDSHFHRRNGLLSDRSKLVDTKINIIGVGALGSEIADNLSKSGIGELNLIDKEIIKVNNVVRHLVPLQFVGYTKNGAVAHIITSHNPFNIVKITDIDIIQSNVNEYLLNDSISISSMADDNTESLLNEQSVINNKIIFYTRALRGGKAARIFRVIPGKDACFNCLSLYNKDKNPVFKNLPFDESLPTITNECNNPIRPASAPELKLISSLTSRIVINFLQNESSEHNHWILITESLEGLDLPKGEYMKVISSHIPPHKDCKYCNIDDPLTISILSDVLEIMQRETQKDPEIETGGILLGSISERTMVITLASGPGPSAKKEKTGFLKDREYCQSILNKRYEESGTKEIYLGEWHYHPSRNNNPSNRDLKSLSDISLQKEYITTEPVMIILSNEGEASCTVHPVDSKYYHTNLIIV